MKTILKYIIIFVLVVAGLFFDTVINIYKDIILNTNIVVLLVTLIAGLFGFIVAVIPFAIQLFNQDNSDKKNSFLNKLMTKKKFDFFVKPMFNRFIKMLYVMFILFLYTFLLNILQTIDFKDITFIFKEIYEIPLYKYGIVFLFYLYVVLIIQFFTMLRNIIRDLQTLVFNFFKVKEEEFKYMENK